MTATKLAPSQREEWSRQTLFLGLRVYLVQNRPTPAPLPPPDTTTAKPRGRWVPGYSTTAVNNRPTPAPRPPPYSHQPVTFMQGQRIRQDFTKTPCPCSLAAARRLLKDAAEATGTHAPLVHACCRSAVHNRTNMFTTPAPRPPAHSVTTATGYRYGHVGFTTDAPLAVAARCTIGGGARCGRHWAAPAAARVCHRRYPRASLTMYRYIHRTDQRLRQPAYVFDEPPHAPVISVYICIYLFIHTHTHTHTPAAARVYH